MIESDRIGWSILLIGKHDFHDFIHLKKEVQTCELARAMIKSEKKKESLLDCTNEKVG